MLALLTGCASQPKPVQAPAKNALTPETHQTSAKEEVTDSEAFSPTPLESPKVDYVPPPPDAPNPPAGHVVFYTDDAPTVEMCSNNLQRAFSPGNPGRVTFQTKKRVTGELKPLAYTICQRGIDFRFYFIVPEHRDAVILNAGDCLRISGTSGKKPEIYRFRKLSAGYYDMGFHLMLQTAHRFIESGSIDDIDGVSVKNVPFDEVTADGGVITLPKLPKGDYAVKVGYGNLTMSIPVLYDFSVR
jgi:hypothetical protein